MVRRSYCRFPINTTTGSPCRVTSTAFAVDSILFLVQNAAFE
jgi:hypothetical protein